MSPSKNVGGTYEQYLPISPKTKKVKDKAVKGYTRQPSPIQRCNEDKTKDVIVLISKPKKRLELIKL